MKIKKNQKSNQMRDTKTETSFNDANANARRARFWPKSSVAHDASIEEDNMRGKEAPIKKDRVVTFTKKKRNVDMNQQPSAFRWVKECFRFRGTVVPSVLPQMILAFLVGIFANALKIQRCGENVMEDKECDVAFSVEGHTSVAVVVSFLLVFRVNLAYEKWDEAREAIERVRDGVRNLNVAFCSFVCASSTSSASSPPSGGANDDDTVGVNTVTTKEDEESFFVSGAQQEQQQASQRDENEDDRKELARLSQLLFAFFRIAIRESRIGYSEDVQNAEVSIGSGTISADEVVRYDRAGKPSLLDLLQDPVEIEAFVHLEPFNRANAVVQKILDIVEKRRRLGKMCERGTLDIYRDCSSILAGVKTCERITTTPTPNKYTHMLTTLLFFFVYSAPFCFTASFDWLTPMPSALLAMAFYGVAEVAKKMENPFGWEAPSHDLSQLGAELFEDVARIHESQKILAKRSDDRGESESKAEDMHSSQRAGLQRYFSALGKHYAYVRSSSSMSESSEDTNRTQLLFPPGDACVSMKAAKLVVNREVRDRDLPPVDRVRRGDGLVGLKSSSSFKIDFILDIFQWRDTILPDVIPQLVLTIGLALFAQGAKFLSCGSEVTDASECLIAMDPTAHGIAAIALGFLLVFRADWAYDRYYEAKECLGRLHVALRNVNVLTSSFIRPIDYEGGEKPSEGDYEYSIQSKSKMQSKDKFEKDLKVCEEAKMEILRLTNIAYASVRIQIRESRVGDEFGRKMTAESMLTEDPYGCPKIPELLVNNMDASVNNDSSIADAKVFNETFEDIPVSSRCAYACLRIQTIVEHQRRLGNVCERAAFEVYQTLEETLAATRAANRVATTPVPRAFTHLLQLILFSFVFTAPFVFVVTFKWIAFIPSGIVVISCYGINEMGTAMADPFNWTSPSHDLSDLGRRLARESAQIHEFKRIFLGNIPERPVGTTSEGDMASNHTALEEMPVIDKSKVAQAISSGGGIDSKQADERKKGLRRVSEKLFNDIAQQESFVDISSTKIHEISTSVQRCRFTSMTFFTALFAWKNTVLPAILWPTVFAGLLAGLANYTKVKQCGVDVASHQDCIFAFSDTAHSVCGGVIGFTLCFRASISYYRYYEAKKFMGALCEGVRNFACGSLAFLRPDLPGELQFDGDASMASTAFISSVELRDELRRLSNCLFGSIRHITRESRYGVRKVGEVQSTNIDSSQLIREDPRGKPSLAVLLTANEKELMCGKLISSRPAIIVAKCQKLVEEARKRNEISERGAFDLYDDLNDCLVACNNLERINETKMPWIYLHLLNFALFAFVYSAPFIFTAGFGWLSPAPAMLIAIAFYGTAEVARNMENPFDYDTDGHDIEAAGSAHYKESRIFRELMFDVALPSAVSDIMSASKHSRKIPPHSATDALVDVDVGKPSTPSATLPATMNENSGDIESGHSSQKVHKTKSAVSNAFSTGGKTEAESRSHARVFRDVFKFRNTVLSKLIPQCIIAGALACLAQAAKIWKCGADVRDPSECQVTFSKDAHTAVASILAFVIVYRFRYAYERYYEAKVSLEKLRRSLRNLNMGTSAFVNPQRLFITDGAKMTAQSDTSAQSATICVSPRAHILRLTTLFFAVARIYLRESALGAGPNGEIIPFDDAHVLLTDRYSGSGPNLGRLLDKNVFESEKDDDQLHDALIKINDPVGRLNFVATKLHAFVENLRIKRFVCDRGATDLQREIRQALSAVVSCHRAAHTQTPRVLVHAINVIVFFFVFSSPLLFTASFKYAAFWPAILVSLCFYSVLEVGERLEKPFGWIKPNHDLSVFGHNLWHECEALHHVTDDSGEQSPDYQAIMRVKHSVSPQLTRSKTEKADLCEKATVKKILALAEPHESITTSSAELVAINAERGSFHFISQLFVMRGTIYASCVPQLLSAVFVAYFATILKEVSCGKLSDAMNTGDCFVSFDATAHRLTGVVVGFALSHIAHVAYRKWYEVLIALDNMYDSARSINVMAATCFGHNNGNTSAKKKLTKQRGLFLARSSATEEELSKQEALTFFFSVDSVNKGEVNPNVLRERVRRLLDLALVFARRTVCDHRLGVPIYSQNSGSDIENTRKLAIPADKLDSAFTVKPLDPYDIANAGVGAPSIADVFTHMQNDTKLKTAILATSHQSRAAACIAELQRTVEFARKNAFVSDEAAFDCYNHCENFLQSQTTILRVVDTPVPTLYRHVALTALFFYAFSAPFSFASSFGWLSPVPSAVLVLGFYGAAAVGEELIDPLAWTTHAHDGSRASKRVFLDNDVIYSV